MTGAGRASIERHVALCEKEMWPDHVRLWRRLAGLLGRLTPDIAPLAGPNAIRFYAPDGKYRLQVFALEDLRQGDLAIYLNDSRASALSKGVLAEPTEKDSNLYGVNSHGGNERLLIEPLTSRGTTAAPEYYRHMLGWHRTAIRITLGRNPTPGQIRAAETMCVIAVPDPAPAGSTGAQVAAPAPRGPVRTKAAP